MKKIFSILLAVSIVFSLTVPVLAAGTEDIETTGEMSEKEKTQGVLPTVTEEGPAATVAENQHSSSENVPSQENDIMPDAVNQPDNPENQTEEENTGGGEPSVPSTPEASEESQVPLPPVTLEIDTRHTYQGMDMPYESGYSPKVENGTARIVLPLTPRGKIKDNKIKVSLDLGVAISSPFVFSNYERIFELSKEVPMNEPMNEQELFLVDFSLPLDENRTNGVYPVILNVTGFDEVGNQILYSNTINVTISDATVPEPTEKPQFPTQLEIDTTHIYSGMSAAYENGYAPLVNGNWVHIVLPLVPTGNLHQNEIKASLNPSGSTAFVPTNYEKKVTLQSHTPKNDTQPVHLFMVEFDVELSDSRTNGVYPLTIQISGFDDNAQPISISYPFQVTISDSPLPAPPKPKGPEWPTPDPVIYIANSKIEPEQVMAGEDFTVTVTLKNSLTSKSVSNMMVRVDPGNLQVTLQEKSRTFQVKKLGAGEETEMSIKFHSDQSIPAGKYNLGFQFTYDSGKVMKINSNDTVTVNIQQPANMELVMPRFASSVTVGETIPLNLQVMNMGRGRMNNVRCVVSGFGFAPANTGYIGAMEAGSSSSTKVDLYIVALNTCEGNEDGEQYGDTTGTITLIYEDDSGKEFQQTEEFTTTVKRPIVQISLNDHETEKQEKANQVWWYVILILGGVILAAVIGFIIFKCNWKNHKKGLYL